ncbi:MAG: hypothetical protein KDD34_02480 [Bdellovibrionales bacterium]|nr:hypothetical protein [Bdellovibrionales bacterium]
MKLFIGAWLLIFSISGFASTTKVGNGDDGSDLEGLREIKSGIIFSTRAEAIKRLRALNVQGIQGLGALIPELENTKLLMANSDVHPLDTEGEWETSQDQKKVFARTFAEPHAPTRFFPVALSLNREQLIALHTHEAMHRALPEAIRENEDKVAFLTLALTSPSATFDRVNRIVQNTLQPDDSFQKRYVSSSSQNSSMSIKFDSEEKTRESVLNYGIATYSNQYNVVSAQQIGAEFSPLGVLKIGEKAVEPRLKTRFFLMHSSDYTYVGPASFTLKSIFQNEKVQYGPLAQVHLRALESDFVRYEPIDRDIYTLGGFFERQGYDRYLKLDLTYTLPSTSEKSGKFGAIWSADLSMGYHVKKFIFGLKTDFDHMVESRRKKSFSLLQVGPDLGWKNNWMSFGLSGGIVVNRRNYIGAKDMTDLGDMVGHGMGDKYISFDMSFDI